MCLLFCIFYQKKAFEKFWKMSFSLCLFNFSSLFSLLFPQFPDWNGKTKKWIFVRTSCNSKGLVTSSRGAKEKIRLPFSWSLLKITYFQKSHTCVCCFGLFTKLKRRMALVFTTSFLHTFFMKMFIIKYPISFNIWGSGLAG